MQFDQTTTKPSTSSPAGDGSAAMVSTGKPLELRAFKRQQTVEQFDPNAPFPHRQFSLGTDVSLAWRNLRYEVREHPFTYRRKVLLRRLTGQVKYRSLNGFMGPSGAGKTTLLSCLNGNIRRLANGSEMYVHVEEQKVPLIGFIEQHVHETIIAGLTVGEVLRYSYRFKNEYRHWVRMEGHIRATLQELLLDETILERKFGQCSGGEQKRVAIAQELMAVLKPTFLFIDEPTTGLDSQAALLVMQCLRRLATANQMTLMVTIHMPNDAVIRMFDQLYILAKGGICIYAGRREFLRRNLRQQLGMEIPDGQPPIEEYLKIACNGIEDDAVLKLAEQTLVNENEKLRAHRERLRLLSAGMPRQYKRFSLGDFLLQLWRLFYIIVVVDFRLVVYQALCYTGFFLAISTVFNPKMIEPSTCYNEQENNLTCTEMLEESFLSSTYVTYQGFCVMFFNVINLLLGTILFTPLLKVFRNEHRNRWYSMSAFYWPFIVIRFLEITAFVLIITVLIYFPTRHHYIDGYKINWLRIGHFAFFIWISCIFMQSVGQFLSLIFVGKMEIAMITGLIVFLLLNLPNGYLVLLEHMENPFLMAMSKVIGTKYITHGLLYSAYGLGRCNWEVERSVKLEKLGVNFNTVYTDLVTTFVNIGIFRIAAFVLMYIRFSLIWPIRKRHQTPPTAESGQDDWAPIHIDTDNYKRPLSFVNVMDMNDIHRPKNEEEREFEEFSRNKIIIGWRQLTLFGSASIREIRSARTIRQTTKVILRDLNGHFRFGTLNALMGTSGAGKTSFLKILNARSKTRLTDETRIYISRFTPTRICYLTQEVSGHLWPGLTAKQSLIYASRLKNCFEKQEPVDHEKIAWKLLDELDIKDTADTLSQRCSGGEKKRLALALELTALRMPNLICIDEPTSGLDSFSSDIVIACLRKLVHRHSITIVASIHQPSTEMLMMFDNCYVLARGGVCIYSGTPNYIPQFLVEVPEVGWSPKPDSFPVEELIKWSCRDYRDPVVQALAAATKSRTLADDADLHEETQRVIDGIQCNRVRFSIHSVWLLCGRYWLYVRNHLYLFWLVYIFMYLAYGIIIRWFFHPKIAYTSGCISPEEDFNNVCNITEDKVEREVNMTSNVMYCFFFNIFFLFVVQLQAALFFCKESAFFFNEHRNGWYSTGAYYLMKSIYDVAPMIPVLVIYVFIIDMYEPVRPGVYWWLLLLMMIAVVAIQGLGHILALAVTSSGRSAPASPWEATLLTIATISFFFIMTLMANFLNPISKIHYIYQVLSNFSLLRWLHEATILLLYGFGRCRDKEIQGILYLMEIPNDQYFYRCIQLMLANTVLYRVIAIMLLIVKSNPMRNRRQRAERIRKWHQLLEPTNAIIPGLTGDHPGLIVKLIEPGVIPDRSRSASRWSMATINQSSAPAKRTSDTAADLAIQL